MAVDGSDHSTDTLVPTPALLGAPLPPVWPGSLLTGENLVGGAANDGEGPNDADLRDFNAGDTPAAQFQMEDQTFGPTPVVIPEPDSLILLGPVLILIGGILLAAIRVQK